MNSLERVSATLGHKTPDKVPLFLFFTTKGADIANLSIPEYFQSPETIAKAQMKLQDLYNNDLLYPFIYAAKEYESFGGESNMKSHGPPESGRPVFTSAQDLLASELPSPSNDALQLTVKTQKILYNERGNISPIINAIIAPFSLPIMLLGFERWIEAIVNEPDIAKEVVSHLVDYSITYSNYLLENGATALAYFNPLASPQMVAVEEYRQISFDACRKYYKHVKGPAVYALAGAKCEPILSILVDDLKVPGVVISRQDDLMKIKNIYGNRTNLIGNLDNIAMTHWNEKEAEREVKRCIDSAAKGGGYILADHHGDLPQTVSEKILKAIVSARDRWGTY